MYHINEESFSSILHVYGGDQVPPEVSGFDTIVKVDKKTEEKLMQSCLDDEIAQNNSHFSHSQKKGHS